MQSKLSWVFNDKVWKTSSKFFKFIIRYVFKTTATIKHVYDITSPDLLPISFIWMIQCKKSNVHYIGDTKTSSQRQIWCTQTLNQKSHHTTTHWSTNRCFRSLYPSCPFYGQHRIRSSRTHHLKWWRYSLGKRSLISDFQGQDNWTFWVKQAWRNLIYLLTFFSKLLIFLYFC